MMQKPKEVQPKGLKQTISAVVKTPLGLIVGALGFSFVLFNVNKYWYRPMIRRKEFREAEKVADFLLKREFEDFDKKSDDVE